MPRATEPNLAATGLHRALLMVEGAGDPDRTLANIARLGTDVIAPLRAWSATRSHADSCI